MGTMADSVSGRQFDEIKRALLRSLLRSGRNILTGAWRQSKEAWDADREAVQMGRQRGEKWIAVRVSGRAAASDAVRYLKENDYEAQVTGNRQKYIVIPKKAKDDLKEYMGRNWPKAGLQVVREGISKRLRREDCPGECADTIADAELKDWFERNDPDGERYTYRSVAEPGQTDAESRAAAQTFAKNLKDAGIDCRAVGCNIIFPEEDSLRVDELVASATMGVDLEAFMAPYDDILPAAQIAGLLPLGWDAPEAPEGAGLASVYRAAVQEYVTYVHFDVPFTYDPACDGLFSDRSLADFGKIAGLLPERTDGDGPDLGGNDGPDHDNPDGPDHDGPNNDGPNDNPNGPDGPVIGTNDINGDRIPDRDQDTDLDGKSDLADRENDDDDHKGPREGGDGRGEGIYASKEAFMEYNDSLRPAPAAKNAPARVKDISLEDRGEK